VVGLSRRWYASPAETPAARAEREPSGSMCGLLGVLFAADTDADEARPAVEGALACQRHRGPDESGVWSGGEVVLAFNRLSIIDLEGSHQPLHWGPRGAQGRYTIVFNGEIYNYLELRQELIEQYGAEFATEGDTELILAAYHYLGHSAVSRLRGMFAFLIWDSERRMAFVARDRFGIKPLFYAMGTRGVAFSSEKKSLLELAGTIGIAPEVDRRALQLYLLLQYVPEPDSLHSPIHRLDAGTALTLAPGGEPRFERYFSTTFRPRLPDGRAEASLCREITEVLRDSVAKHMRADVTVGAFLSGGIDSTAIAALAKERSPGLMTFTAGFERPGFSEVDVAAESAAELGIEHRACVVTPQDMMESLPLIIWYLDDPVADPALVPLWFVAREAREHVKVVLSGEGADELFGGYSIYREPRSLAPFEKAPRWLRNAMGRAAAKLPEGVRGKDLLRRGQLDLEDRYYGNARIFRDDQLATVMRDMDPTLSHQSVTAAPYRESAGWDPVTRMQHVDIFTWLRGDILVKADKMTMANSLELRVPFLDSEVFRVAAQLPSELKVTKETTKRALRQALREIVPASAIDRPKLGWPVPIRHWLKDEMHEWAVSVVRESQADHLIDGNAVLGLIERHRTGAVDHSRRIWAVLVLLLWHGIFVEGRIRPHPPEPRYAVQV
jgi:asparagine synthase (glutamine-hydrolysing)